MQTLRQYISAGLRYLHWWSGVDSWPERHIFYAHVGLYGFRRHILPELTALPQSPLELAESLEQLRWIENGYKISVRVTTHDNFSIDTPEDLEQLLRGSD